MLETPGLLVSITLYTEGGRTDDLGERPEEAKEEHTEENGFAHAGKRKHAQRCKD